MSPNFPNDTFKDESIKHKEEKQESPTTPVSPKKTKNKLTKANYTASRSGYKVVKL